MDKERYQKFIKDHTTYDTVEQYNASIGWRPDIIKRFVQECCVVHYRKKIPVTRLHRAWRRWYKANNLRWIATETFAGLLKECYPSVKLKRAGKNSADRTRYYFGISLKNSLHF